MNTVQKAVLKKHMGNKYCNRDGEHLNVLRYAIVPIRGGYTTIFVELKCPKCGNIVIFRKIIPQEVGLI